MDDQEFVGGTCSSFNNGESLSVLFQVRMLKPVELPVSCRNYQWSELV